MRPIPTSSPKETSLPARRFQPEATPSSLDALDDHTLLCLLLDRVLDGPVARTVASNLLERFDTLGDIAAADVPELGRVRGAGPAVILELKLLRQLSIRLALSAACRRPVLSSWDALRTYAVTALSHLPREQFRALYLDRRNILIRDEQIADDPTVQAAVDRRIERMLDATAARIVAGRSRQVSGTVTGSAEVGPPV